MLRRSQNKPITTEDTISAIARLQRIEAALAELRRNGYRLDRSTSPDSRSRYWLRAVNERTARPDANTCTNHPWKPAKHDGLCRLCIRQAEMGERWRTIRKALATVRRSTRKPSPAGLRTPTSHTGNRQGVSKATPTPATVINSRYVVVVVSTH
jgi:hypothetical protein